MPFITEELYEKLDDRGAFSACDLRLPEFGDGLVDEAAKAEIDWLVRLISAIRSTRSDINVPASADHSIGSQGCRRGESAPHRRISRP